MKRWLFTGCIFLVCIIARSQDKTVNYGTLMANGASNNPLNGTMLDPSMKSTTGLSGDAWKGGEIIKGTIFYWDDMSEGYILLEGEKIQRKALLRYNVYSHEINYLQDKQELVLNPALPVREFGFSYKTEEGNNKVLFRSGYPAVGSNTSKTYYEVIAGSNIALLKYTTKKIVEKRNNTGAFEKLVNDAENWYVFDSTSFTITGIKKNKNALIEALPQYANQIKSIVTTKDLYLKNDDDWIILFNELNNIP